MDHIQYKVVQRFSEDFWLRLRKKKADAAFDARAAGEGNRDARGWHQAASCCHSFWMLAANNIQFGLKVYGYRNCK
jgi:hypothetical protein